MAIGIGIGIGIGLGLGLGLYGLRFYGSCVVFQVLVRQERSHDGF